MVQRVVLLLAVLLALPSTAHAQTVREVVHDLLNAAEQTGYLGAKPEYGKELERASEWFEDSAAGTMTPEDLAKATFQVPRSFADRLRWNQQGFAEIQDASDEIDRVNRVMNDRSDGLIVFLRGRVSDSERDRLIRSWTAIHERQLELSLEESHEILRRYERKFGPGSTKLNVVETILNLAASRLPSFGPNERGEPGPFEVVSAYSSSYLGYDSDVEEPVAASILELGLRHYNFGREWGQDGFKGALLPTTFSFGVAVSGDQDRPLYWPFRGKERWGGFFSWGDYKLAYVSGDTEGRWLLSKQFQLLPGLF